MKKSLVSLAVLAYVSSHPVYGQTATKKTTTASKTNTFKSEKLSPLPLESKRGDFQMREFDALEIPEYKLNEAYLEKSRQEISILGNLLNKSTTLNQRSDILFRTAELHWSIEKTIYFKKMEDYNQQYDLYMNKKIKTKPAEPKFGGHKTMELYKQIIRENSKFDRIDEILFLAGYRGRETKDPNYAAYLRALIKNYPNSKFLADAYMEIGEDQFNKREFDAAIDTFNEVLKRPNGLHNFALYKISWCYYNQGKYRISKEIMQRVVESSKGVKGELNLRNEALRDLVIIFSDLGLYQEADQYFTSIGEPEYAIKVLEKLSDIYFEQARYELATATILLLLQKAPDKAEAPKYHSKLIDCYERSQKLASALKEMATFLSTYEPNSRWETVNRANEEATEYSNTRSEVYARFIATRYHEESQKYEKVDIKKAQRFSLLAMGFYDKYFERFSQHPNAYNLRMLYAELLFLFKRFDRAAEQYGLVFQMNPKGKYASKALTGQIDSLSKIESENYEKIEKIAESKKATGEILPFPEVTVALIKANENYVRMFPNDPKSPEVYYQRARLYYNYNHFSDSQKAFQDVVAKYPNSDAANQSRHLILDIYNIQKDWDNLEKTATAYLQVKSFATEENQVLLLDLIQGSIFQRAKQREDEKKHLEAARIYQSLTQRFPKSKYADKALFNAAMNYISADASEEAISTSQQFLTQYPNSELGPKLMLSLAGYFDEKYDYQNAAKFYELYAQKDPKATVAPDALFNAALYQENLKNYPNALKNYDRYMELYPTNKDASVVFFSRAMIYEKLGQFTNAAKAFEEYAGRYAKKGATSVEALYRLGKINERLGKPDVAANAYRNAVKAHKRLGTGPQAGSHYASKALFEIAQDKYKEYQSVKLAMPERALTRALSKKADLLKQLKEMFAEIINLGDPEMGVASLYYLGLSYQEFSQTLFRAPVPPSLSPEEVQLYQVELQNRAMPIEEQGVDAFEKALKKGYELDIYSEWTRKSYEQLSQYKPSIYPPQRGEMVRGVYVSDVISTTKIVEVKTPVKETKPAAQTVEPKKAVNKGKKK
jgi:TolA-binding protein